MERDPENFGCEFYWYYRLLDLGDDLCDAQEAEQAWRERWTDALEQGIYALPSEEFEDLLADERVDKAAVRQAREAKDQALEEYGEKMEMRRFQASMDELCGGIWQPPADCGPR